jgi:hypothetical protein
MLTKLTIYPDKRIRRCPETWQWVGEGSVTVFSGHRLFCAGTIPSKGFDTQREALDYLDRAVARDSVVQWLDSRK